MMCLTIHAETPPHANTADINLFCKPEYNSVCKVTLFLLYMYKYLVQLSGCPMAMYILSSVFSYGRAAVQSC